MRLRVADKPACDPCPCVPVTPRASMPAPTTFHLSHAGFNPSFTIETAPLAGQKMRRCAPHSCDSDAPRSLVPAPALPLSGCSQPSPQPRLVADGVLRDAGSTLVIATSIGARRRGWERRGTGLECLGGAWHASGASGGCSGALGRPPTRPRIAQKSGRVGIVFATVWMAPAGKGMHHRILHNQ